MGSMSPKLAQAVLLRVGLELPYDEVARRLRCSESAARVRVARGLARQTERLEVQT
ncbi:MAG TPA: sigma factor-like helix-turn-helix DNA-binding protein [Actinomycetota bacterium]|nr:sigma factor-like helix-turn-helix DNA-binding protein [Actinomycetota bacterium]